MSYTEVIKNLDADSQPDMAQKRGLIVCNIGAGKGKTTASMGVAVRASGAGMDVFILQFVKAAPRSTEGSPLQDGNPLDRRDEGEWPVSNEIKFFQEVDSRFRGNDKWGRLGKIDTEICGAGFVGILGDQKEKDQHIRQALKGLERAHQILVSGKYHVVIFDELLSAVELNLLTEDDVVDLLKKKPEQLHVVITGHNKYQKVLKLCDTVTEMKMLKHAYYEGVL